MARSPVLVVGREDRWLEVVLSTEDDAGRRRVRKKGYYTQGRNYVIIKKINLKNINKYANIL